MSSLHPGETGRIGSDPIERWVQLTRGNPDVVQTISESYTWANGENQQAMAIARYMLSMCGNNWRARCEVHGILSTPKPGRSPVCSLNGGVSCVLDTVMHDFINSTYIHTYITHTYTHIHTHTHTYSLRPSPAHTTWPAFLQGILRF